MSKDTVISHGKDIVCVMAHSYSPSLNMVRSRIGAFWRGLTAMGRISPVGFIACRSVNNIRPFAVRQCHAGKLAPTSISL